MAALYEPGVEARPLSDPPPLQTPRRRWPPEGWFLSTLYVGFPLWWLLGLGSLSFLLVAVPMSLLLVGRRQVLAPRGFGLWLAFLLVVISGVAVLAVDAPGAVPGVEWTRYLTFSYRVAWYLTLTVVLLYVGNVPERDLPTQRVVRLLGVLFIYTVIGGYLGLLLPRLALTSPMEMITPESLGQNAFFRSLVHPITAQIQDILGYDQARPAAPFAHSNDWGANFGLLLPFFVLGWLGPNAGRRRYLAPLVLLAAVIPAVFSLNRALWVGLAVVGLFLLTRIAVTGRLSRVVPVIAAGSLALVVVAASPLGGLIQDRFDTPHSNEARGNLAQLTVSSTALGSPIIGFGSTRDVPGNFTSIAGGATDECPRCAPPALGTQGHAWLVILGQGFLGALLFFAFLGVRGFAHLGERSPLAVAGLSTLVFLSVVVWFYDLLDAALFNVMVILAILWRASRQPPLEDRSD